MKEEIGVNNHNICIGYEAGKWITTESYLFIIGEPGNYFEHKMTPREYGAIRVGLKGAGLIV